MSEPQTLCLSPHELVPPVPMAPEDWLVRYDSRPRLVPHWPASTQLTLVAVCVVGFSTPHEQPSRAFVLTEQSHADDLVEQVRSSPAMSVLFFTVPREIVMPCCPGLTQDSWQKEFV